MRLNGKIILKGIGLHSGRECEVKIEPCDSKMIMLNDTPIANLNLNGTNRGSDYIFPDGGRIRTCEHVLSALYGMGIYSGVNVNVSGGEMPALDGCSRMLCDEILRHSDMKDESHDAFGITEPLIVYSEDKTRFVAAFPCDELRITYTVEYKYIGAQVFDFEVKPENYYREVSSARTFAMLSDIEYLRAHGMALGGTLDNAIAISENGIQASGGLHWPDEFVRHKVLDLIGDLAAAGKRIKAHIIAMKAGHELHLRLSEKIRAEIRAKMRGE